MITDTIWEQLLITMKVKGCRKTRDNRDVLESILWKLRTGAPWRDFPEDFCPWKTAFNRFNRWAQKGLWEDFFLNLNVIVFLMLKKKPRYYYIWAPLFIIIALYFLMSALMICAPSIYNPLHVLTKQFSLSRLLFLPSLIIIMLIFFINWWHVRKCLAK